MKGSTQPYTDHQVSEQEGTSLFTTNIVGKDSPDSQRDCECSYDDVQQKEDHVEIPWQLRLLLVITTIGQYIGGSAIYLYIVMDLDFGPVKLTEYSLYMGWAYLVTPIIGFVADIFVFRREKRRPLVVLGALGSAGTFLLFITVPYTTECFSLFVALSWFQTISGSFVNTAINGILVEIANHSISKPDPIVVDNLKEDLRENVQCRSCSDICVQDTVQEADGNKLSNNVCMRSRTYINHNSTSSSSTPFNETVDEGAPMEKIPMSKSKKADLEKIRTARMGKIQSEAMFFRTIGSLIASLLYTVMTIKLTTFTMIGVSVILYMATIPAAFLLGRHPKYVAVDSHSTPYRVQSIFRRLINGCNIHRFGEGTFGVIIVLIFVFIYTSMPDASTYYFTYVATEFSFSRWFLSFNMTVGTLGSAASSYIYMYYMKNGMRCSCSCKWPKWVKGNGEVEDGRMSTTDSHEIPLTTNDTDTNELQNGETKKDNPVQISAFKVFVFGSICASVGYGTNVILANGFVTDTLKIPAEVYIPFDNFMTSLWSRFAFLPVLSVAAERCPEGYEAAIYEMFSVASFSGGTVSRIIALKIGNYFDINKSNYSNLWKLLLVCSMCKLLPIILVAIIPVRGKKYLISK
eukprot:Tbor_TRINITY_DN3154_c0_g1::TRINITY_DN3154_c0_g1_i1::g.14674::m.14674